MRKKKKIFRNQVIDKKQLKQIMSWAFNEFGIMKASYLATKLKDVGFRYATQAGLSISIEDLRVPPMKTNLINSAAKQVHKAELEVSRGEITEVERFQQVINIWNTTSESLKEEVILYFRQTDPLNSIYMMAFSGARGNLSQVRQLVGMRGLMADPTGQIIDLPIVTNFREGLTVTDYIISAYGARKGLVDTALRTADSGYLTRRLIDVAQDIITREKNCKTKDGISLFDVVEGSKTLVSLHERIVGRSLAVDIKNVQDGSILAHYNEEITPIMAKQITDLKILKVNVRSPLTCSSSRSVCQQCYGWNLAYGKLIDLGEAVGIIAAQSIGEPGTQLTMRTFHTGGVFTAEPSRQIRAEVSGKIVFSENLKTQITRTQYGKPAHISQNEASLKLITFANFEISLEIFTESLIFAENNSYVKKDDVLFELISKTRKTGGEKAYKYLHASQSGEVVLEKDQIQEVDFLYETNLSHVSNCLLWILSGQVYNIPLKSNIQLKPYSHSKKNQVLAEAKLTKMTSGVLQRRRTKEKTKTSQADLFSSLKTLTNSNLYVEESLSHVDKSVILYGSKNRRIIFKSSASLKGSKEKGPVIGSLINKAYKTKTGGSFYGAAFNKQTKLSNAFASKIKAGGTVFYIPESTYKVNQNTMHLHVKNGDYVEKNFQLFKNHFSTTSGLVEIIKNKKTIEKIVVKPVSLISIPKEKDVKKYDPKLVYPGQLLFESIQVEHLAFSEIQTIKKKKFLALYPIIRYEIINEPNELSYFSFKSFATTKDVYIGEAEPGFNLEYKRKGNRPIHFIKRPVIGKPSSVLKNFRLEIKFVLQSNKTKLHLLVLENIDFDQYIPTELKKADFTRTTLVQNKQFIEPYTTIASFQVLISNPNKIKTIKEQYLRKERKILVNTEKDYKRIFIEDVNMFFSKQKLLRLGTETKNNFILKTSGFVDDICGNAVRCHTGQPYLFSQGGKIEKRPGELIKQGDRFGQLVYERARTGDIVQGLPRIEEILEGRKPKLEAIIATQPGVIVKIDEETSTIDVWIAPTSFPNAKKSKDIKKYTLVRSQRLLIGKFEFINIGQPLNNAAVNPHTVLDLYFLYYSSLKLLKPYYCAYRSFRKIQALLLNSVQAIYYSQGVYIADKHVEIIIKQMTSKVQITSSGDSPLLPEEFIDLRQANYINLCLREKENALYRPIVFGITQASLKTTSFISAASFQYTTRILTEAAIQGKIDWLRGLKENVIVGRLIPAGTGFNAYSDISYIASQIGSLPPTRETKDQRLLDRQHEKYRELKNHLKFKLI